MSGKKSGRAFMWVNMRFKRTISILLVAVLVCIWLMPTYSWASSDHDGSRYSSHKESGNDFDGYHDSDDHDDDHDSDHDSDDDDGHDDDGHDDDGHDDDDGDDHSGGGEDGHDNDTGRGHDDHGDGNGYGHHKSDDHDDDGDSDDDDGKPDNGDSDDDDDGDGHDDGHDDNDNDHDDRDGHGGDSTPTPTPESQPTPRLLPPTVLPATFDLSISKSDNVDPAYVGDTVAYTITVKNTGDRPLTGLVLKDTLAGGMAYKGSNVSGMKAGGGVLTWSLGSLGVGKTQSFRVSLTAKKAGDWLNTVSVSANELPTARQASERTRVLARLAAAPAASDADPLSTSAGALPLTGFETAAWFAMALMFIIGGTALEVKTRKSNR